MLIDWDHASFLGESTKAAGWIGAVEYVSEEDTDDLRPAPGFWGHVEAWTPEGAEDVRTKRFRMISPVIRHQFRLAEVEGGEPPPPLLWAFENVALTNRPNLRMVALNARETGGGVSAMSDEQLTELRMLLGLEEDADADAILEAVRAATSSDDEPEEAPESAELESAHAALRVLESERDAARAELARYREAEAEADRSAAVASVDKAISEGRAHSDNRDDLIRLATSDRQEDRAMFSRLTAHTVSSAPTGRVAHRRESEPHTSGLSAEERYLFINLRSAGLTEDQAMNQINKRRPAGE
jgi:phage I-like protein